MSHRTNLTVYSKYILYLPLCRSSILLAFVGYATDIICSFSEHGMETQGYTRALAICKHCVFLKKNSARTNYLRIPLPIGRPARRFVLSWSIDDQLGGPDCTTSNQNASTFNLHIRASPLRDFSYANVFKKIRLPIRNYTNFSSPSFLW